MIHDILVTECYMIYWWLNATWYIGDWMLHDKLVTECYMMYWWLNATWYIGDWVNYVHVRCDWTDKCMYAVTELISACKLWLEYASFERLEISFHKLIQWGLLIISVLVSDFIAYNWIVPCTLNTRPGSADTRPGSADTNNSTCRCLKCNNTYLLHEMLNVV